MGARSDGGSGLDAYQRSHSWLGFPLAVVYKVAEDRAYYLAALVTYYTFVSVFPLLLLFVSIMGFILQSHPRLRGEIVNSTISSIPGIGEVLKDNIGSVRGSGIGVTIGFVGLLYGALGASQSAQAAFNQMYGIPRNRQPNPITSRLRSLGLLAMLALVILASSAFSIVVSNGTGVAARLGLGLKLLGYALALSVNTAVFASGFRILTAADVGWAEVAPGAVIAGAGWELLQAFGSRFVVNEVNHGHALYGVFGVVLATIFLVYLVMLLVMVAVEVNVVKAKRLWPRSLLSPFTDNIDPTAADLAAYRSYAEAQRFKGWQEVAVSFRPPPPDQGG